MSLRLFRFGREVILMPPASFRPGRCCVVMELGFFGGGRLTTVLVMSRRLIALFCRISRMRMRSNAKLLKTLGGVTGVGSVLGG